MFRAQNSEMDASVEKATNENLTSEDWSLIFDVVDRVGASTSGPQQAIAALIKRLSHRNANVQLYTLELANALSQNCGVPLHRELASKAFTDALLRLAADRNTHAQVKQKVLERMSTWTEEFRSNPELGIMGQAYQKLRVQQPGLLPPSKPVKREISTEDRRKEEEELQMALALSIKDKGASGGQKSSGTSKDDSEPQPAQAQAGAAPQGTTAATVSRVRALYDFTPSEAGELAFRKNDVIAVLESVYKDWWKGSLRGSTGIFPLNYVEKLQDPTKEELERDATMEAEVFGEIKNVEKLLALLSVRGDGGPGRGGEREEEEISELYQRTLSIRPKLIELIGRYTQKKDDFTQLNEKFIKARRDYEALLESSMSQPQYQQQYPIRPRQAPQQVYPPQQLQQAPYGGGYPPQGQPLAGYPPQPAYPQQTQQHLPPQQDVQRYYSPSPSEPPQGQPQPGSGGYSGQYPPQNGPPVQAGNGPAPFHFIPGGVPGAPPSHQQLQAQQQEIRRKPSPQTLRQPQPAPINFQSQVRPNSIHTLNSGNPQELGTGGYDSPVDNRHSYPSAAMVQQQPMVSAQQPPHEQGGWNDAQQAPYTSWPTQQQQQRPSDLENLPSRQRTQSFESQPPPQLTDPVSAGAGAPAAPPWALNPQQQQQGGPVSPAQPFQAYQAYQPVGGNVGDGMQSPQAQRLGPVGGGGEAGDPGDFYR